MGPNLFACNENIAYVMPNVTTCAVTSCAHHTAGKLAALCIRGMPGVWDHVPEFLDSKFDFNVLRESGISQFKTKKVNLIEKL